MSGGLNHFSMFKKPVKNRKDIEYRNGAANICGRKDVSMDRPGMDWMLLRNISRHKN